MHKSKLDRFKGSIFLCGFMGAGKSTIGKALAQIVGMDFKDLDNVIEKGTGKKISGIFSEFGENRFRDIEWKTLQTLSQNYKAVVALGGGSLHNQHVVDHLKLHGLLIFIETPFDVLLERITKNMHRPLLLDQSGNMKEKEVLEKELYSLYKKRLPFYRQSQITIETDAYKSVVEIATELKKKILHHV